MPNWCMNWFTIEIDKTKPGSNKFINDLKRYQIVQDWDERNQNKGTRFFDEFVFNLDTDDKFEDNTILSISGTYTTKWAPLGLDLYKRLADEYPAIKFVSCEYEEFGAYVAGKITATRVSDKVKVENYETKEEFWDLLCIRDTASDLKRGYDSMEECAEVTGLESPQIEAALKLSGLQLEDFNNESELPDPMDYLMIVER